MFESLLALIPLNTRGFNMDTKVETKKAPEVKKFLDNRRRSKSGKKILEHKASLKSLTKEQRLKIKKRALKNAKRPSKRPRFVS